jgi:hypothetical protein
VCAVRVERVERSSAVRRYEAQHDVRPSQRSEQRLIFEIHAMDQQTVTSVKGKLKAKLEALVTTKQINFDDRVLPTRHCITEILGLASSEVRIEIGKP